MSALSVFASEGGESVRNVLESLEKLTEECCGENRDALDLEIFPDVGIILKKCFKEDHLISSEDEVLIITEIFRLLRNSCANSKRNQNFIRGQTDVVSTSIKFLKFFVNECEKKGDSVVNEKLLVAGRCCIQFFTNFMVENVDNVAAVGAFIIHDIASLVIMSEDEKVVQYGAMCIHVLVQLVPPLVMELNEKVIPVLLNNTQWEFVMYAIETLLDNELFMMTKFTCLVTEIRVKFIQWTIAHTEIHSKLRKTVIKFFADQFKQKSDLILKCQLTNDDDVACWEIASFLELLCIISVLDESISILSKDGSLMTTTIYLLKSVHAVGKGASISYESSSAIDFSPVSDIRAFKINAKDSLASSPTFQFKAHLIRLLANLMHQNFPFQEMVRETEVLSVILDNCKIDARNPFITEYAIYAIRNACEGNSANQEFVKGMQQVDTHKILSDSDSKVQLIKM